MARLFIPTTHTHRHSNHLTRYRLLDRPHSQDLEPKNIRGNRESILHAILFFCPRDAKYQTDEEHGGAPDAESEHVEALLEEKPPPREAIGLGAHFWSAAYAFWNLVEAECAVSAVSAVREAMHEVVVANGRDAAWIPLVEVVVLLHRRWYFTGLEEIYLLVFTERKLCPR